MSSFPKEEAVYLCFLKNLSMKESHSLLTSLYSQDGSDFISLSSIRKMFVRFQKGYRPTLNPGAFPELNSTIDLPEAEARLPDFQNH